MSLPDMQKTEDTRGIEIDEVGVSNIRYPLKVTAKGDMSGYHTVADIAMAAHLENTQKGTHMSRFVEHLHSVGSEFHLMNSRTFLSKLLELLGTQRAHMSFKFPIFLPILSPITKKKGLYPVDCRISASLSDCGFFEVVTGIEATGASLCPCSKEISEYGAHNQRSVVTLTCSRVFARGQSFKPVYFEDLAAIAADSYSCRLYPLLKRPDEKWVTEKAYDNPKFVEDIARDSFASLTKHIAKLWGYNSSWVQVKVVNEESIHHHNACARIEIGDQPSSVRDWL